MEPRGRFRPSLVRLGENFFAVSFLMPGERCLIISDECWLCQRHLRIQIHSSVWNERPFFLVNIIISCLDGLQRRKENITTLSSSFVVFLLIFPFPETFTEKYSTISFDFEKPWNHCFSARLSFNMTCKFRQKDSSSLFCPKSNRRHKSP